ncbi:MAG: pyridoxamine 5'-phosphate oxidase family protein [Candidatus Bipolaricaulota bacterium]|nr:pyridoxamine 5'-phosphate oxidase family protein [Candidatus Bipolaricaulota bacterium]
MPRYHLRRAEREIVDRNELDALLRRLRYMTVALCRDGEPYAVTLNHGYCPEENALYFHCAREGLKLEFLRANPRVCATAVEDLGYREGECSHGYRSVVVRGRMRIVEDLPGKARGLRVLLAHQEKDPQALEDRLLPDEAAYARVTVLRLEIEEITGKASV